MVGSLVVRMCPHRVHLYVHASIEIDLCIASTPSTGVRFHLLAHRLQEHTDGCMVAGMCKYVSTLCDDCTQQHAVEHGKHAPLRVHLYVHALIVICAVLARNLWGLDSICVLINYRST